MNFLLMEKKCPEIPEGPALEESQRLKEIASKARQIEPVGHSGSGYLSEEYAVRRHWVRKILLQFDIPDHQVRDCFSSHGNARFAKHFVKFQNALLQHWDPAEVMWCNPPWSIWPEVAEKILGCGCRCIGVLPAWHSKVWVQKLLKAAVKTIYFEVGSRIFELSGRPVGGIRWGLYVLLVDNLKDHVPCAQVLPVGSIPVHSIGPVLPVRHCPEVLPCHLPGPECLEGDVSIGPVFPRWSRSSRRRFRRQCGNVVENAPARPQLGQLGCKLSGPDGPLEEGSVHPQLPR